MNGDKPTVNFAAAISAGGQRQYEADVLSLDSLPTEEARKRALSIIRRLAYSAFQMDYSTESQSERFEHLWRLAFPEKRSKFADLFEERAEQEKEKGGKK